MTKNNNNLIIAVVVIVAIIALSGTFGFGSYRMMGVYGGGFMLLNLIFSILVIVLIIIGVYWLINNVNLNGRRLR